MTTPEIKSVKNFAARMRSAAVWGPGILVTLADTDVGNIVTAAQSGAQWGYRLLGLVLVLIPLLYMLQELTVRLGIFTGLGLGELIRQRYGKFWSWCSVVGLAIATFGSLITEFTGVAAVGDLYGVSRTVALSMAATALFAVVLSGSYRRIEKIALIFGMFELSFFVVAWLAHPNFSVVAQQAVDIPFKNHEFMFLAAALIGSVFNPWMIYYQQSAIADKGLKPKHYSSAKWDTAVGAVLTQFLTAAVLIAVATTLGGNGSAHTINNIGEVSNALIPLLGGSGAHLVFSLGVLGAAMVAAIVSSLALAWGFSEAAGYRRTPENLGAESKWFYVVYAACIAVSASLVGLAPDLVWLDVVSQVVNTFMLPILIIVLLVLTRSALPVAQRLHGWYLWLLVGLSLFVCGWGLYGGISILL